MFASAVGEVCPVQTFCGREIFRRECLHFGAKSRIFRNLWCVRTDKGGWAIADKGEGDQFSAEVFNGQPIASCYCEAYIMLWLLKMGTMYLNLLPRFRIWAICLSHLAFLWRDVTLIFEWQTWRRYWCLVYSWDRKKPLRCLLAGNTLRIK